MPPESQGQPPPQGGQGGASGASNEGGAKPFSFESEEQFNERINRAITGRLNDFGKKLDGRFGEIQTGLTTRFDEFGKLLEGLKPPPAAAADAAKASKADPPPPKLEDSPEWKAHQAKLTALEKKAQDSEARERAAVEKTRASDLRTTAAAALVKSAGVAADRTKGALALLVTEERRIAYADDGKGDTLVWREQDGTEVPLEQGLKSWAKTGDAKIYQPPQNPNGSGGGPRGPGAPPPDPKDPRSALRSAVRGLLAGDSGD